MNSIMGSIFNEKIAKNEVYGSVNSARVYCSRKTWSTTAIGKKKEKAHAWKTHMPIKSDPNRTKVSRPSDQPSK